MTVLRRKRAGIWQPNSDISSVWTNRRELMMTSLTNFYMISGAGLSGMKETM